MHEYYTLITPRANFLRVKKIAKSFGFDYNGDERGKWEFVTSNNGDAERRERDLLAELKKEG